MATGNLGSLTDAPSTAIADEKPATTSKVARGLLEWAGIILAALVAAFLIKTFLIQAFYIPSGSMENTLEIGDRVLVNKLSYKLHDVHRGDIVVFERPSAPSSAPVIKDLIKRVIGVSGDTVEGRDGRVYVNGKAIAEPYLDEGQTTSPFGPKEVPDGKLWVMGDNRGSSSDSRVFGFIDEDQLVGRAFIRVWPLPDLTLF